MEYSDIVADLLWIKERMDWEEIRDLAKHGIDPKKDERYKEMILEADRKRKEAEFDRMESEIDFDKVQQIANQHAKEWQVH